jgi:NADPH:quinone reductase-like Zn-dependent oxidoreductase
VLKPGAIVVLVGGPKKNRLLGPVGHMIGMRLGSVRSSQSAAFLLSNTDTDTLTAVAELVVTGKVKPLVERVYELSQAGDALRYVGEGHAQGKVVVTVA